MPPVPGSEVLILGTNRRRPPDAPELGTFRPPRSLPFNRASPRTKSLSSGWTGARDQEDSAGSMVKYFRRMAFADLCRSSRWSAADPHQTQLLRHARSFAGGRVAVLTTAWKSEYRLAFKNCQKGKKNPKAEARCGDCHNDPMPFPLDQEWARSLPLIPRYSPNAASSGSTLRDTR